MSRELASFLLSCLSLSLPPSGQCMSMMWEAIIWHGPKFSIQRVPLQTLYCTILPFFGVKVSILYLFCFMACKAASAVELRRSGSNSFELQFYKFYSEPFAEPG